ncbi:glycosyltransferase family 2 protein [Micromonospora sp. NBC_00389]|uniref:glycosyltransferase family 2 protein n=1 Tax=Micromonospora sp. NBC_00389 TaxID=2903586 RepID=UPI002E1BB1F7
MVVTYNSARFVPDLIASLAPGLRGLTWHLTVADNASSDDTVAVLRNDAPWARVVETGRNGGYAAGINAAVAAAAPHDAVLVLNPDIRLAPDCVPELLAVLRRRDAGIVVPRIVRANGDFSPSLRREPTILRALGDALLGANRIGRIGRLGEVITDRRWYAEETSVDWAEGSIMLIDRACWDACGQWDESFFLYSEETEFALRARDRGFAMVLAPRAQARHLEGDSATSPRLWALLTLNRVRLYHRRHSLPSAVVYWSLIVLREASRAVVGNRCSQCAVRSLVSLSRLREPPGPMSVHPAA